MSDSPLESGDRGVCVYIIICTNDLENTSGYPVRVFFHVAACNGIMKKRYRWIRHNNMETTLHFGDLKCFVQKVQRH